MTQFEPPLVIPPHDGESRDAWKRTGDVLMDALRDGNVDPAVHSYAEMAGAFQKGNVAEFNLRLADYRSALVPGFSRELRKSRWEVLFNRMQPFYTAMFIYVAAGLLAALYWFTFSHTIRRIAFALVMGAFLVHTTGLIFRMALEGRPPVTNLYSSAIFIGWGGVRPRHGIGGVFGRNAIGLVVFERDWFPHADHRASPCAFRRHDGNDARRARHEFLVGNSRGRRDAGLCFDIRCWEIGDSLCGSRIFYACAREASGSTRYRQIPG